MDNTESKKLALLRIRQILEDHSDTRHPLTQAQIGQYLKEEYGIGIERKAIGRNLALLKEAGIEIESAGNDGCYLSRRDFEPSELRFLIDSVLSSRQIAPRYSREIIEKLFALSGKTFRSRMHYADSADKWNKTEKTQLFYQIELTDFAIARKKQVRYTLNRYGTDGKLHPSEPEGRCVSPWQMILNRGRYYLMAYAEKEKKVVFHPLDRITDLVMTDLPAVTPETVPGYENGIDYRELTGTRPYLYSDTPCSVTLRVDETAVDLLPDWFGGEFTFSTPDKQRQRTVTLTASPTAMYRWAMQYADHAEVLSPAPLRDTICKTLTRAAERYGK